MTVSLLIALIGILVFLAHLCARVFERTKISDVLLLLLAGLGLQAALGSSLPTIPRDLSALFGALTLTAILFEGGLDLPLAVLQKTLRQTFTLAIFSFIATMAVVVVGAHLLTGLDLMASFVFGAIVGCTSPAVVVPLVRQIGMKHEGEAILSVESAVSNILSFVVTFALLDAYRFGRLRIGVMVAQVALLIPVSVLLGFAGGLCWLGFLDSIRKLRNSFFTTLAFVFTIFGVVEVLRCSGYIAALAFGATLGNGPLLVRSRLGRRFRVNPIAIDRVEKQFFSEIVFLLKSFFFLYMGFTIELNDPGSVYLGMVLTTLIFVLRVPVTRLCVSKSICASDASLIAAMSPKGIAVASLATIVASSGMPGGEQIRNSCFAIVFFSITASSALVFLLKNTRFCKYYLWFFSTFGGSYKTIETSKEGAHV